MKHYILMSILIFQFVCLTTQAQSLRNEKRFWATLGGGGDFTFAFPYGTGEDVPVDDFFTSARGIPVKTRLGILFGNESPAFIFLSAQKTFFIDPIENVPDFGTGLGMIFPHRKDSPLYHLVEIGAKPTRDTGTLFEFVVGEGVFLGPVIGELTGHMAIGGREDSPTSYTIALTLHFIFPVL